MKEKLLRALGKGIVPLGLFLLFASLPASAQDRTVTGKVTDENDQGLPGVSVTVKGTTRGTNANSEGNFTLPGVKDSDILVFSSIGYLKQELSVGNRSTMDVKMAPDAANLQEVVVTALGISKESRKIGYAVSTIEGSSMTQARETNVAYSMAGRVAGLNISGTSGGPGSSARILLRGMASFSAGSPLFVINGVPIDNSQKRDGNAGEWAELTRGRDFQY
jgi:hypothetical protein